MTKRQSRKLHEAKTTAVFIRIVAFIAAAAGLVAIPATIVASTSGHLTLQTGLVALAFAVTLIAASAIIVRPFDPLRQ